MKRIALAACLALPLPVQADECTAQIAAMFDGGALDAYQRPPHRHEKQVIDASGNVTITFASIVETPLRTISGVKGGAMTLTIDDATWTGSGAEGPWTPSDNNMPKNREAWHKSMQAQQAANLTDTSCQDGVVIDGNTWNMVAFSTKTDPNPDMGGAFFGSSDTVYIDPETRQVMLWEQTGLFSSWLPEPGMDTQVTRFRYDPSLKVTAPD